MKRCVEVLVYKVRQGKVDDCVAINKVRYKAMKKVPGCRDVLFVRLPFGDNVYCRMVIWDSKDTAMKYCGKRLQRKRFLTFLKDNVELSLKTMLKIWQSYFWTKSICPTCLTSQKS